MRHSNVWSLLHSTVFDIEEIALIGVSAMNWCYGDNSWLINWEKTFALLKASLIVSAQRIQQIPETRLRGQEVSSI